MRGGVYSVYLPAGLWVSLQRSGLGLSGGKTDRGQGGIARERKLTVAGCETQSP